MALAAMTAYAFVSCSMAEQVDPADFSSASALTVKFTTKTVETKAAFGEFDEANSSYPTFWTAADQKIAMSLNYAEPVEAIVSKEDEVSDKADFTATFEDGASPYEFFALSPIAAVNTLSESRGSWSVTIPTVQTPKADGLSCDEAAMILYSKSASMTALPVDPVALHFSHVTSYCRLVLKNLASAFEANSVSDASIKSVDISFEVPVAGDWYINATDGTLEEKEASYTITLKPTIEDLTQSPEIWFALAPCTLDGTTVKVSVNTDKGCLSREYTYGTRTYAAGAVNRLALDMTKNSTFDAYAISYDDTYYQLVTALSGISANDEVIFVDATVPSYAMGNTTDSTNGFNAVAKDATDGFTYSTSDGKIRLADDSNVMVWTVASKSSSSVTFKNGSKYLSRQSSGNSHYPLLGTSSFTFTLALSNGNATLSYLSNSRSTTYYLYYNSNHFQIISNTSKTFAIYKKVTTTVSYDLDPDNDPINQESVFGAYLPAGNLVHTPGVSQLSREYSATATTFAVLFPADNTVLEFSGIPSDAAKGDTFSLSVTKVSGRKKTVLGVFNVTVVKEEGSKLWLSDFNGNGFIVKR